MALDVTALAVLSTTKLEALRNNYLDQQRNLPRQHRAKGRPTNLPTDIQRCKDAIRLINAVLRSRRINTKPLAEFE
jgi:hypothetical protein